ncbi:MAG: hypothetical protein M1818_001016 [Claussenomyces sp. TS43310]|nr:MAG: hypothetical protein M1818_001016 [Claussenomyces sp. TS43310]
MGFLPLLSGEMLLVLAGLLSLTGLTVLCMNKQQRELLRSRLFFLRHRDPGSKTPPRSLSPGKSEITPAQKLEGNPAFAATPPNLIKAFPPSRREALVQLAKTAAGANKRILIGAEPSKDALRDDALPSERAYDLENDAPKYTATGFSTAEIKALGDFPAYDVLSGVRLPQAYPGFDPSRALARPYRPLRWVYHQTMSFQKMEPDWWLELENTYVTRVTQRRDLYAQYGKQVLDYLPGSELACKELMEMCVQFYCLRYPALFSLSDDNKIFHNKLLKEDTDITSMHPLRVLLNNVPEDFAITLRNEHDGQYYFRAGVVCSSLGWNVNTKIGMCLKEIHVPIPDYKEKMSFSMDRYFSRMTTDAPIQRGSWGLEVGQPLFMPPGHPHEKLRESQAADLRVEDCHLRVDWQTLRRLPLSAAIVFNFKALYTPVPEFRDEPYVPALLLAILRQAKPSLMEYKGTWHVEHVCIPALERYAAEQKAKGLVLPSDGHDDWVPGTLQELPYFPGWQEKWHRQQGF